MSMTVCQPAIIRFLWNWSRLRQCL